MKMAPELEKALEECGFPWELQQGSKHYKLRVGGKMVTVLPLRTKQQVNRRVVLNTIKNVRHMVQKLKEQP